MTLKIRNRKLLSMLVPFIRSPRTLVRKWMLVCAQALFATMLCACGNGTGSKVDPEISLGIIGYNYTNRYIDFFSVNGQGGGNVHVSSPTSGGSGLVCCAIFFPNSGAKTVRVRWQSGGCYFSERSSLSNQTFDTLHSFFKEQDVPLEVFSQTNAQYLEVHFYLDGSVKAAVTADISSPRLALDKQRADQSRYPRCPGDKEPKE